MRCTRSSRSQRAAPVTQAGSWPRAALSITWVARLVVAALFLFAGVSKLSDPSGFAVEIDHYELWPELAPYVAISLPAAEVVLGLALLLTSYRWRRAAALGCMVLMAVFTFAASAALYRGLDIDCGCFGGSSGPITWLTIVRDVVLLSACVWLVREPSIVAADEQKREG